MSEEQAAARLQQRIEELCGAAVRALAGDPDLHFRARRLHRGRRALPIFGPHLQPAIGSDDFASFRGATDAMALRLTLSDAVLHRSLCPPDRARRWIFEWLEQCRVESLAPPAMTGLVHNLRHRYETWSAEFMQSRLFETANGLLLFAFAQISRARVTGEPMIEAAEDPIEGTRATLVPVIGNELAALRRSRNDQAAYAPHALALADTIAAMLVERPESETAEAADEEEAATREGAFSLLVDFDREVDDGIAQLTPGRSAVLADAEGGYRVFSKAWDVERRPAATIRAALLAEYRERLDRRIAEQGLNVARLARQLQALLSLPARDGWVDDEEEGRIDGRRLAQLVVSPAERRLFRNERLLPATDCVVAFLIDCSGSMKQHIEAVALIADVLLRALEQAGAASELLGFTTGAWNGGRAAAEWRRAGRPAHPGRLNEVEHLIFKDADTPWRRARRDIAALLRAEIFREGIDGEAVDWACDRLESRAEARRILIVVSDGCPMDGATALANDAHYLEQHLREVVARREQQGRVEIHGLGVGLDLSGFYGRSRALDLTAGAGNAALHEIVEMLAGRGRR